jgi:hypothetical protein
MQRRVTAAVLTIMALTVVLVVAAGIARQRERADRVGCLYRFERLGQFAAVYNAPPKGVEGELIPQAVPPGTVPHPTLPPDRRLSWIAGLLPVLDSSADFAARLDPDAAWDADGPNRDAAAARVAMLTCPGTLPGPLPGGWMPTQFVGLAGVGTDAAELPLTPLAAHLVSKALVGGAASLRRPVHPRAGCFRYDAPTPLALVRENDGLSHTALFAETATDLGPWIRGGSATVRGLDVADGAKPFLGTGGQFGGNYDGLAGFGFADGSARFIRTDADPAVLKAHFTLAGTGFDVTPGE